VLRATSGSYEVAKQLREAGNITELDLSIERSFYEEARLGVADADATAFEARLALGELMGVPGAEVEWSIEARLAELPKAEPKLAGLQDVAVEHSLDLLEIEHRYAAAARRGKLARAEGWLPRLHAGVSGEKEDGEWKIGPAVEVTLPLFDQGQGRVGAASARMRALQRTYEARELKVRRAVQSARRNLLVARQRVEHYETNLLPIAEEVVAQTLLQYNAMNADVFQLIDAKRNQVETARQYVAALRAYWVARATLDQLLAGRLVTATDSAAMSSGAGSMSQREDH
jgi:cobalt-zinc-cadmium efflux system outer membrane protein